MKIFESLDKRTGTVMAMACAYTYSSQLAYKIYGTII